MKASSFSRLVVAPIAGASAAAIILLPIGARAGGLPPPRAVVFTFMAAPPVLSSFGAGDSLRLVVAVNDVRVSVLNAQGLSLSGWPVRARRSLAGSPFVFDLDGDGRGEVFAALDTGGLARWNENGDSLFIEAPDASNLHFTRPAAGDLDGDGKAELVSVAVEGQVAVWNRHGRLREGWPHLLSTSVSGRAAIADVDDRPGSEIIVADGAGSIHVLDARGEELAGWPLLLPTPVHVTASALPRKSGGACPVVATFDVDGWLRAFDPRAGVLPGWPAETRGLVNEALAVGDLDRDGSPEFVVSHRGGTVMVVHADGTCDPRWPRETGATILFGPTLADVTGDGLPEILVVTQENEVWALNADGTEVPHWRRDLPAPAAGSPVAGDIDADGLIEVITGLATGDLIVFETDGVPEPGAARPAARALRTWQNLPSRGAYENALEISIPSGDEPVTLELLDDRRHRAAVLIDGATLPAGRRLIENPGRSAAKQLPPGMYTARLFTATDTTEAPVLVLH